MDAYLDGFVRFLRTGKSATESTLQSYRHDVAQFLIYLKATAEVSPQEVTPDTLTEYIDSLRRIGRAASTISRFTASVRCFYQYLMGQGIVQKNPAALLHVQREQRCLPEILTNDEVDLLFAQPDCGSFKGVRDKAMLELLYATGIRVSELVALNVTDISLEMGSLCCHSENKRRVIPIYREAVTSVSAYMDLLQKLPRRAEDTEALFVNVNGRRLSRQGFWKIVKGYAEQAGISKCITPHTLRHSFAVHLLENGADLKSIQMMLGHADISSTLIYEPFAENSCRTVYNRCHPKA